MAELCAIIEREAPEVVVVGLPLTLRGERGPQAVETEAFIARLRSRCRIPILTEDERLTTSIARRMPTTSRRRTPTSDDAQAAAVLLQSFPGPARGGVGRGRRRRLVIGALVAADRAGGRASSPLDHVLFGGPSGPPGAPRRDPHPGGLLGRGHRRHPRRGRRGRERAPVGARRAPARRRGRSPRRRLPAARERALRDHPLDAARRRGGRRRPSG